MIRKSLLCGAAVVAFASSARATVLFSDSFSYPDGPLDNSSTNTTSPWTETSRPQGEIQVAAGEVNLNDGGSSGYEAVGASFSNGTATSGATVYSGFDINFSAVPSTTTSNDYFAEFKSTYSGLGAAGRVLVEPASDAPTTAFQIGVSDNSSLLTAATFVPTDLGLNTTYHIVEAYSLTTGQTTIYVNPTSQTGGTTSANTDSLGTVGAFSIDDAIGLSGTSTENLDNLVVATTFAEAVPEPTSVGLIGLSAVGLLRRRRRQA